MTVGEVAASIIGRPHKAERWDGQSERLQRTQHGPKSDGTGVHKGFQNRPTGLAGGCQLVNVGGMERTDEEYRSLFEKAGFRLTNIVPLMDAEGFSVFEGVCA
jgi:hypothetical protein